MKITHFGLVVVLVFILLAGVIGVIAECSGPELPPTPIPDTEAIKMAMAQAVEGTMTALAPTLTPTQTCSPTPTVTLTPSPTATPTNTQTLLPTATPTPTPTPTAMPTPTGTLPPGTTRAVKGLKEDLHAITERFMPAGADSCELQYPSLIGDIRLDGRQLVTISYPLTFMWTEKSALEDCTYSFRQTVPELFSFDPCLDEVRFMYEATVIDKHGAESMEQMLKIHITRDQADKIVWANLSQCNIPVVVDHFSLHQSLSLRQAWSELCP